MNQSLEYLEKALKIKKLLYPGNHPDIAQSLNNIAYSYYMLGDYTKALDPIKESVE